MNTDLRLLYNRLYNKYGPQGWWPLILNSNNRILTDNHGYHILSPVIETSAENRYEIITGAVLTQNINWKNVYKCLLNLKSNNILSAWLFIDSEENYIKSLIKSSCYYNRKYNVLKRVLQAVISGGYLKYGNIPERDWLLSINGVGEETADTILLYCYNQPFFVIDAYTKRLVKRLYGIEYNKYENYKKMFEEAIDKNVTVYNEYHALIVRHSVEICKKKPECLLCFLVDKCSKYL